MNHLRAEHSDVVRKWTQDGLGKFKGNKGDGNEIKLDKEDKEIKEDKEKESLERAKSLSTSVKVRIVPRVFTMSSTLLWQAMEIAINDWHWPTDITAEQFLDTYLYLSFKQRGKVLGGYATEEENA